MGDEGDYWRDVKPVMKERSRQKRDDNRRKSAELLTKSGVQFESKNDGAHLIVTTKHGVIDFWPGTGRFIPRGFGKSGRGVFNLLKRFCT